MIYASNNRRILGKQPIHLALRQQSLTYVVFDIFKLLNYDVATASFLKVLMHFGVYFRMHFNVVSETPEALSLINVLIFSLTIGTAR